MTDTFTWRPVGTPTGQTAFRVRKAPFGDGYSQEVADGLNNKVQSWPLDFAGYKRDIEPIVAFLDAHAGYVGFFWTPPLGVQGLYKVTDYKFTPEGGDFYTLSATFEQKFAP
jgi:phage-related protein